jgi:thiamine pyrophosphate-dependent acetolactate synthase large subunit-like protein
MRTITKNIYYFSELSEEAKQQAIEKLYNINVDFQWWKFTYEDAETVGLKINGFSLDRNYNCNIELIDNVFDICHKIIENHGEICDTYKTAKNWLSKYDELFARYEDENNKGYVDSEKENDFDDELSDLEHDFKNSISSDYLTMLRNEYEYLTSEEAIIETIIANDYEFYEDCTLI